MKKDIKNWLLSEYNEGTVDQLDYYMKNNFNVGDTAYLYAHANNEITEMEIVKIISRSDDTSSYDNYDEDVLLKGEDKFGADTSAEFITDKDCHLVWFKYTTPLSYGISLKTLYDNDIKTLHFGGKILHTEEDGTDFYDLRRDDSDLIILCDGEKLTDCKWYKDEDGNFYLVGTAEDSAAKIYLSKDEFDLAVFQYQKTDIEKLMDEIRKLKSSEKKDIKFDMDARNEIHVELAVYMNGEKKTIIEWRDKITGLVHEAATCDTSDDSDVRSALEYIRRCCLDSIE